MEMTRLQGIGYFEFFILKYLQTYETVAKKEIPVNPSLRFPKLTFSRTTVT